MGVAPSFVGENGGLTLLLTELPTQGPVKEAVLETPVGKAALYRIGQRKREVEKRSGSVERLVRNFHSDRKEEMPARLYDLVKLPPEAASVAAHAVGLFTVVIFRDEVDAANADAELADDYRIPAPVPEFGVYGERHRVASRTAP